MRHPVRKRWLYWKRRYSNPTYRDWLLLLVLLWVLLACVLVFLNFRLGAFILAVLPAGLGVVRLLPAPWGQLVRNRSLHIDCTIMFGAAALLFTVAIAVPGV